VVKAMKQKRRLKILVFYILLLLFVITSCSEKIPSNIGSQDTIRIGMIPKISGISYFDQCAEGAKEIADQYGMELIYRGPSSADAASQVNIIQDMIYDGVDVIAIAPVDPDAVKVILDEARNKGIIVVTFDADSVEESRDVFVNQVSAEQLGMHIIDNLVKLIGDEGNYAILTASLTADNQNTWIQWMKAYQADKYPKLNLLTIVPTDEDQQKAYAHTRNLIQAYPELDGIVAMSTEAGPGAAQAVKVLGKKDAIKLYALALPNDMNDYLKEGSVHLTTLWNPYDLGRLTIEVVHTLLQDENIVDGAMYGEIGPIKYIESEKTIIMGEPLDFNAMNVDDFDF
jgi:rhamnose transport system substrate-binding protein/rhamnose transport system permease protein